MNRLFQNKILYLDEKCTLLAEPEQLIKIDVLASEGTNLPLSDDLYSVWDLVAQYTDLHAMVNQNCVSNLASYATDPEERKELQELGNVENCLVFR